MLFMGTIGSVLPAPVGTLPTTLCPKMDTKHIISPMYIYKNKNTSDDQLHKVSLKLMQDRRDGSSTR